MHSARCTPQVQAAKYKVPEKFLEETPDSRSTLLAVCEKAAEDLKLNLRLLQLIPKYHQRKLPGAQECIQHLLQISVIASDCVCVLGLLPHFDEAGWI